MKNHSRTIGNSRISILHVAKAAIGMTEEDYRSMLVRVAGVRSSKDLNDSGFVAVMEEFKRLGFVRDETRRLPKGAGSTRPEQNRPSAPQWRLMESRARAVGFDGITDPRFVSWAKARGQVDHPKFLDAAGAQKIIGALGKWMDRIKAGKRGETEGGEGV